MAVDYIAWIKDTLNKKPHLNQSGLARHLGRDRSVITMILRGDREIKASELDKIEAYLGEPRPDRQGVAAAHVAIVGRLGVAWYEVGAAPGVGNRLVSPDLSRPDVRQIAYLMDSPLLGYPAGAVVIAVPVERGKPMAGGVVVVRRERAGLENLILARADEAGGTVVAVAIEVRVPV